MKTRKIVKTRISNEVIIEQIKNAHKTDVYKHFKKEFKEMEGQKLK